jgi:Tfp pilus assembly protein PilF
MRKSKNLLIVSFLISLITILVYIPALHNDFVNWDDHDYIYKNSNIQSIDPDSIKWMFTAFHSSNWHPLTWFSHAIDYAVWALNPMGHHLTSVLLHGLNTFLVVILVMQLMKYVENNRQQTSISEKNIKFHNVSLTAAAVTGLLFGLHPIHVESVAWISERKDVLYSFFWLLCILSYLKYTSSLHRHKTLFYIICLLLFVSSLMSKPMAVTLPLVLIIIDFYPLQRIDFKSVFTAQRNVLIEKLPFLLLSTISSIITVAAQHSTDAIKSLGLFPLGERVLTAIRAPFFYIYKMLWPKHLLPLYPSPPNTSLFSIEHITSFALIIATTAFCIYSSKKKKIWIAVWVYYLISLLPVLGIVQVGVQVAADRYTYLASLGPFLIVGLGITKMIERAGSVKYKIPIKKPPLFLFTTIILVMLLLLANLTVKQIRIWKDSVTLWTFQIKSSPDSLYSAYYYLANAYQSQGLNDKALKYYMLAIKIGPPFYKAHSNLAVIYESKGSYDKAIEHARTAIKLNPSDPKLYYNLGMFYQSKGNAGKSIENYLTAITLKPDYVKAHYNLGIVYRDLGLTKKADEHFGIVQRLKPSFIKKKETQN